jgi:hypothetical protein
MATTKRAAKKPARKAAAEQQKTTVEVVSFKQWLILRDVEAYSAMLSLGLALTKFDEDTLLLLKPLLRRNGIVFHRVPWPTEFEKLMSKLRSLLGDDNVVNEGNKVWFVLDSKKQCDDLQERILQWLEKRSFVCEFERREKNGRWILRGAILFDRNVTPIFVDPQEDDDNATIQLDSSQDLQFFFGKKPMHLHVRVNARSGEEDQPLIAKDIPFSKLHRTGLLDAASLLIRAAMSVDKFE